MWYWRSFDGDTLTAVVPKNEPVHAYDLIVVNNQTASNIPAQGKLKLMA